jgi:signal transduction histidine kinase
MSNKPSSFAARWMLSPLEIVVIVGVVILTIGGLFLSVQDALQLDRVLNLDLTNTVIVSQGIVNLQREVQLTHNEVSRLLGNLDNPPKPITRFDFVMIQVNNLTTAVELPSTKHIFASEDITLVQSIKTQSDSIKQLIGDLQNAKTPEQKTVTLRSLDAQLGTLEATVKKLIDIESNEQREAIVQTKEGLSTSQRTSLLAGGALLLMGLALAIVFRRALILRLQQALEADRLKSQLMASVSHELRTPLTAIKGYSELLTEDAYGTLSIEQHAIVQRVLLNTVQLQGMVNNLLDHAQMEQGKFIIRNAPFSPVDLLETSRAALSILATTKGVELKSEIAPDMPALLIGDVLRLQQILFNLTSNALKFTQTGSVEMRIFQPDAAHWALQVIDTGIGMPIEAQAHIFEPFWQIDTSATRKYRGSGLGLSIVKQLADLMNGKISLVSQPEKGSTFTVTFPVEVEG